MKSSNGVLNTLFLTCMLAFAAACGGSHATETSQTEATSGGDMTATSRPDGADSMPQPESAPSADQLAQLVQQEAHAFNMLAPIVKAYTMSDSEMTPETIAPHRAALIGWGQRLRAMGGEIEPVFPELQ